jgi:hypothetical protein
LIKPYNKIGRRDQDSYLLGNKSKFDEVLRSLKPIKERRGKMSTKKKFFFGDMSKVLKGFEGKWVALSIKDGQVVISGSGESLGDAIQGHEKKG